MLYVSTLARNAPLFDSVGVYTIRGNSEEYIFLAHTTKDRDKLFARVRRIRGQVDAIERALAGESECEEILQLVASCRGALNGLMGLLIEGHLRFHVLPGAQAKEAQVKAADELLSVVKRYFN